MIAKSAILFLLLLFASIMVNGQTLNELREKKEKTRKEIEYTNWLLEKTGKTSKATVNKLSLLNEQIKLRESLIHDYNTQINMLESSIGENRFVIQMMNEDLDAIRENYARMIQQAYRKRGDYNKLIFLLSSETFNQAYKRLLYTRQMTQYRQKQLEQIEAIRFVLQQKVSNLNTQLIEKEKVLLQQMKEVSTLKNKKEQQSATYENLQKRQRELKEHLSYQQRIADRLQNEIERVIEEEARKAKAQAKTPEYELVSDNFAKNKGRFPWPVENGVITDRFGEHAHPVLRNIIIKNNGIDITTRQGESARSVFNGTVSRVFAIPGGNTAVIIRHGEYISVYSNLSEVFVSQGENVETGQEVGSIFVDLDDDNKTVLKFQIWKENLKLNPEDWIAR
ncbi:MAG: peptidoglycan DD-metalloendopeptidase family protein [Prolixibacteraceae bacterium]|jgi:septal ring factor EnvC (AmiA/AmiB activator)|nr:peptidoglycan DD-metalloendopeptidase family protein [Prolixibacteraceae bacterium]